MNIKKYSELTRFIRDISSHQLEVIRDDGLYRHLSFQRPNTRAYSFDIITWPGYLTVTGDMGTWTFSRIADMFQFFAAERQSFEVNPGYWSEKFESGAGGGRYDTPCFDFDEESFEKSLKEWLAAYLEDCEDEDDRELVQETVRSLTGEGYRNAWMAAQAVNDADFPSDVSSWDILDGMGSLQKHSHHYLWICYAIAWGIERYNNQKLVARAMDTFLSFLPVHAAIREVKP